jgi:hypothetical protein
VFSWQQLQCQPMHVTTAQGPTSWLRITQILPNSPKWISNQPQLEETISKVATVMKKASALKVSAQLRKLTSLQPVKENTRWSSTFNMLERFLRIQAELSAVSNLIPLIPTLVEQSLLTRGFEHLERFHAVTIMLQKEGGMVPSAVAKSTYSLW